MTLARQRACALRPIWQLYTTLLLNINRTLGLRSLGLGLILLFLLLGFLGIVLVGLALLPLLRAVVRRTLDCALLGALLAFHCIVAVRLQVVVVLTVRDLGAVGRVAGFFLLARFLLLRLQTAADMLGRGGFKDRSLAVLADDCFEKVFLARFASWEGGCDFIV